MMPDHDPPWPNPAPAYLTDVEASHVLIQAIAGAVIVHLKQEAGDAPRRMFIELSVSEARRRWHQLGEQILEAEAMECRGPVRNAAEP